MSVRLSVVVVLAVFVAATDTTTANAQRTQAMRTAVMQDDVPTTCPVTKPAAHPFVLLVFRYEQLHPVEFWFGTRKLWTVLHKDGTWKGLPYYTLEDPTFRQKLFWRRHGNGMRPESEQNLTVTGRRLDAPAPPLHVDRIRSGWPLPDETFKVVGVNFPTAGCWEIKGQSQDAQATYVVWVTQ